MMVLYNYLEANAKVPWEDLRYLFGEIMYGGHITDDWDRKLCKTYLEVYLHPDMVSIYHVGVFWLLVFYSNPSLNVLSAILLYFEISD